MILQIDPFGQAVCLYTEAIDLASLGELSIRRASHVEPDQEGNWHADLSPVGGPALGPCASRSIALAAEAAWLEERLGGLMAASSMEETEVDHDRPTDGASDLGSLVQSGATASPWS